MSVRTISARELHQKCQAGECVELIDVRTPAEFQAVHATVAYNVPLDRLDPKAQMQQRNGSAGEPLYIICHSGSRAEMACHKFLEAGFSDVISVAGGTSAWEAAGLPVKRGKRTVISIDRQMRIIAGSLVIAGVLLSLLHPWFIALSAFVGCGLVFAGVTNICPMMLTLARMPWNQGQTCDSTK
jgi:rhodanese-related sulfurtransferase